MTSSQVAGCNTSDATISTGRVYSKPPAYVLAALDAGQNMADNDPRVGRYAELLNQIRSKCHNPTQEISDVAIDVLMTLQNKGVQIDVYELLKRINDAIPHAALGSTYDFNQIAAAFRALGTT
ncbi:MAG: hypothetical protein HY273_05795 [Gammaproteobacteria bacterium]|nr:hypothetical protein [Gammaproteobacteria bacterium]